MKRIIPTYVFIILLHLLLTDSCLSEKDVGRSNETQMLNDGYSHLGKQHRTNKTTHLLLFNARKPSESKIWERKLYQTGYINGSLPGVLKRIHLLAPTFTLSSDEIANKRCKYENDKFLSDLDKLKLWAFKMYDSSGKFSSGFLNGNVNQFGDFDQCLASESPDGEVKGKYCLAYFQIKFEKGQPENQDVRMIFNLVQSHHAFRSQMSDPGNRVPRFSTINWALCIPSSCSHTEVESQLKDAVQHYTAGMNLDIEIRLDEEMCYVKKPFQLTPSFLTVSALLLSVTSIVLLSTIKDLFSNGSTSSPMNFLSCFSLKRNLKQLTTTSRAPDDIQSIHGIRMINALLLLLSHKSMAMFFFPYSNRTYLVESLSQPWTILARIASLYTDSFIMISGILTAYSFIKALKKQGSLDIANEYINRIIRIFPLLIVTILTSTFIIPELGSGPQWSLTINHHSNSCRNSWWKNFLFIHNYFGFENMCLTHTHHLGIDTQLFFTSPLLVYILYKWQRAGIGCLVSIAAISTGLRYHSTIQKELSYFIYPGISVARMMDTANFSYIIPSHRMTIYIIGLIIGYTLQHYGREYKIKSHIRRTFWMIAFSLFCYVISKASSMSHLGYVYDKYEAAIYAALAPVAWCLFLGWIIFASHINYGGTLGRIFSSKYWIIWTRISYAVYLVQFPIFFYNVGKQRYPQEFSIFSLINIWEYLSIITASVVVTLIFDMPSNNIRKLLRQRHTYSEPNTVKTNGQKAEN